MRCLRCFRSIGLLLLAVFLQAVDLKDSPLLLQKARLRSLEARSRRGRSRWCRLWLMT